MSNIYDTITDDVNSSGEEVHRRAQQEYDEELSRGARLDNDIKEQDKDERKLYASLIFTVTTIWLTMVLILFVAIGKKFLIYSDSVIITLLTTTTANVIGLFIIVANYLFKR